MCLVRWLVVASLVLLVGCSNLLPREKTTKVTPWENFQQAHAVYQKVVPGKTTVAQLEALKLTPVKNPNIAIVNYIQVRNMFDPHSTAKHMPAPVAACLATFHYCSAYVLKAGHQYSKRTGNVVLDVTNFKRRTEVKNWTFEAVFVVQKGLVVYKLWSGSPREESIRHQVNPLGPLQTISPNPVDFVQ